MAKPKGTSGVTASKTAIAKAGERMERIISRADIVFSLPDAAGTVFVH